MSDNYFTAGELAAIFNISKQTLLYYNRVGLLIPEFISDNGYRYYSITQYLTLEIIVNLRKLNISIEDIKDFLQSKNKASLLNLLNEENLKCSKIIQKNEQIKQHILYISNHFNRDYTHLLNKISLTYRDKIILQVLQLPNNILNKDKVSLFAKYTQKIFTVNGLLEKDVGYIIEQKKFMTKSDKLSANAYFNFSPYFCHVLNTTQITLPAGFYLEIIFKGTFYKNSNRLAEQITHFLKVNDLQPSSDIYILPLENHWVHNNLSDYVTKIFLRVEHSTK